MSRIYSEKCVIDSCLNANFSIGDLIRIPDKHGEDLRSRYFNP